MRTTLTLLAAGSMLGGCATTSFAPPPVNLDNSLGTRTAPLDRCIKNSHTATGDTIKESVDGALALIDNFMVGYRCAARTAANGRGNFEVPAFLFAATAAVGQSLGVSADATLGLGAGAVGMTQGNSYFAPKDKAEYLNSAIDALTCIQLESVGIPGFDLNKKAEGGQDLTAKQKTELEKILENNLSPFKFFEDNGLIPETNGVSNNGSVSISAQRQYFRLIYGSLLSVERVLSRRLNSAGKAFDPAGIVAEIELLSQKVEDNETDDDGAPASTPEGLVEGYEKQIMENKPLSPLMQQRFKQAQEDVITLKIKDLQPKLQKCIVLAKV